MTNKEVYDAIVSLTSEIKATNIGLLLFEAAKSNERQNVKRVCKLFIKSHSDLYKRMCNFANSFNSHVSESISKNDDESLICRYDPHVIDAPSFFALTYMTDINDSYLFSGVVIQLGNNSRIIGEDEYLDVIEKTSGSSHLADYLGIASFSIEELAHLKSCGYGGFNIYQLLIDAFTGDIKQYYRQ